MYVTSEVPAYLKLFKQFLQVIIPFMLWDLQTFKKGQVDLHL